MDTYRLLNHKGTKITKNSFEICDLLGVLRAFVVRTAELTYAYSYPFLACYPAGSLRQPARTNLPCPNPACGIAAA
jgi:hypothetical protein